MPDRSSQEAAQKTACASCGGGLRICDGRGCRCSVCGAPWLLADVAPPNASQEAACGICRMQNSLIGSHWAWHRFARAELNPVALYAMASRSEFGEAGKRIAAHIAAVCGMDVAGVEKEIATWDRK